MQLHAWLDWFWDQLSQVSQELLQGGLWPWRMPSMSLEQQLTCRGALARQLPVRCGGSLRAEWHVEMWMPQRLRTLGQELCEM